MSRFITGIPVLVADFLAGRVALPATRAERNPVKN